MYKVVLSRGYLKNTEKSIVECVVRGQDIGWLIVMCCCLILSKRPGG